MLTITGIINYSKPAKPRAERMRWPGATKAERLQAKRDYWRANGLCMQHGGERPCQKCAAATQKWRDKIG